MKIKDSLSKISNSATRFVGRTSLVVKKNSPEILMGCGVVSFIGTVILASRASLKCGEVLAKHREMMDEIHDAEEVDEEYQTSVAVQDKAVACLKTGGNFVKVYWPTVTMGSLSLACFYGAYHITKVRYLGAVAAFNAVSTAFETYRRRVVEEEGIDADQHFMYGTERKALPVVDEKGKKTGEELVTYDTKKEDVPAGPSSFARFFDESNPNWDHNYNFSMMFLRAQNEIANNILHQRGHLFLNEVYDMLGYDHTPEGAVVGWLDNGGDGYVDFGLYNQEDKNVRRFVNGQDNVILLDFNHDGVIFEEINSFRKR